jgi:hypothetical protein
MAAIKTFGEHYLSDAPLPVSNADVPDTLAHLLEDEPTHTGSAQPS